MAQALQKVRVLGLHIAQVLQKVRALGLHIGSSENKESRSNNYLSNRKFIFIDCKLISNYISNKNISCATINRELLYR